MEKLTTFVVIDNVEVEGEEEHMESEANSKHGSRKTREELNEIEKQRTKRINNQILAIQSMLEASFVRTRKDKFSVLKSAYEYIIRLNNAMDKIKERLNDRGIKLCLSEDVDQVLYHPTTHGNQINKSTGVTANNVPGEESFNTLLRLAAAPMALLTLDAMFVQCNQHFCDLTGYSSQELLSMSIFNLSPPDNMTPLFTTVGHVITKDDQSGNNAHHIWNQFQFKHKECLCFTSLWLVGDNEGIPAFIQMMLVSTEIDENVSWDSKQQQQQQPSQQSSSYVGGTSTYSSFPKNKARSFEEQLSAEFPVVTTSTAALATPTAAPNQYQVYQRFNSLCHVDVTSSLTGNFEKSELFKTSSALQLKHLLSNRVKKQQAF